MIAAKTDVPPITSQAIMVKEDDKFKSLFSNFEPELSSDFRFMNKLQRNLNSVELVKQHIAEPPITSQAIMVKFLAKVFSMDSLGKVNCQFELRYRKPHKMQ